MKNEKFINEYNMELRRYNEKLNRVYMKIEKEGIVILSNLRIELESEVLNELNISESDMNEIIRDYIIIMMIKGIKENK